MKVYVVSKEILYGIKPNTSADNYSDTTNVIKVFQSIADAISFVKNFDYFVDNDAIVMMKEQSMESYFWAEDERFTLSISSDWITRSEGGMVIRYTLYIEEMELE